MTTILAVDDEELVLNALSEALELSDLHIVRLTSSTGVLDAAREHEPDLCIFDLMLPGVSGIEIAGELRSEGFDGLPIIAITGSPYMAEVADESGLFQAILEKPLDIDALVVRVTELLPD